MAEVLEFSKMGDKEAKEILKKYRIGLRVAEARKIEALLGRSPTLTEAVVWGIMSSEHVSYKSSKKIIKQLSATAPNVIMGLGEDAGIVEIAREGKMRWGLAVSHESHNHSLPIVPFENAMVGLAGNVRDVLCMGAKPVANLDVLCFGNPAKNECRQAAKESVRGMGHGGASLGIPNLGGGIQFDDSFNGGGLLNVMSAGVVREDRIIHSFVPAKGAGYDLIVVGKPTSFSGMGGAVFASAERDGAEISKGAMLEPDPLLMRHLLTATESLFGPLAKAKKLNQVAMKDLGAGGVVGAALEMLARSGLGAEIDLDAVPVSVENLHPSIIACGETQERFLWIAPPALTPMILEHFNRKWDLGSVAEGAQAAVIGKTAKGGRAVLWCKGEKVFEVRVSDVMAELEVERPVKPRGSKFEEPSPYEVESAMPNESPSFHSDRSGGMNKLFVQLLDSISLASRHFATGQYDKNVQGNTVIEMGEADAGLIAPFLGDKEVGPALRSLGVALKLDGLSRTSKISTYWQAADTVVEAMRNVVAVGAAPVAITNCLNFGNPEKPEVMGDFAEAVRGIADACKGIPLKDNPKTPTPVIGGNVSFYNAGESLATIGCVGVISDYSKAITLQLKGAGNRLYLLGERKNELGGSAFYHHLGFIGANVPKADFNEASRQMNAVIEAVDQGLLRSAHDISEGGLLIALAEMAMPNDRTGGGNLGVKVDFEKAGPRSLLPYQKAFSETGGFVVEVRPDDEQSFLRVCGKFRLDPILLGEVTQDPTFEVLHEGEPFVVQFLDEVKKAWKGGLAKML
jgi:phosphoribosylformylglycinamidine synthase subunit PurL